jgi:hypothetical protein
LYSIFVQSAFGNRPAPAQDMNQPSAQWRSWVLILLLFFVAALGIEGRELYVFTQTFREVRSGWLPVQATATGTIVAATERRSASTRTSAVGQVTVYVASASVRYSLAGRDYSGAALGWTERLPALSRLELKGIEPGQAIAIRVSRSDADHATLLGAWTAPSVVPFAFLIAVEFALLGLIVLCGRYAVRRPA